MDDVWKAQPSLTPMLPDSPAANIDNLRSVWLCGDNPTFVFDTGIHVMFTEAGNIDARSWANAMVSDGHADIRTVRGVPGVVSGPRLIGDGSEGGVEVIDHGVLIIVLGNHEADGSQMIAITNTIRPYQ